LLPRALLSLFLIACALAGTSAAAARPKPRRHPHAAPKAAPGRTPGSAARRPRPGRKARRAAKATSRSLEPASSPIVNAEALAPFLTALGSLKDPEPGRVVRVLQFGDSHTAADYWSGRMRLRLQDRFGDGGPGWLLPGRPWRGYAHAGVRFLTGQDWPARSLRSAACDGWVGLPGACVLPVAGEDFRIQAAFGAFRVALLGPEGAVVSAQVEPPEGGPAAGPRDVPAMGAEALQEGRSLAFFGLIDQLSAQPRELRLTLPAGASLLGVELLSGRPGVVYDELGLNGAELTDLERWNPALRRALLLRTAPDLIILAYGTNDEGTAPGGQQAYAQRLRALLSTLREESGAPVLVVGPLDRVGRARRQRAALARGADWIIQAMTQASLETGCAFWDARRAMGGYGAILKWKRAGLAQKDLVHLNAPGYRRLGDLMADALLNTLRPVSE